MKKFVALVVLLCAVMFSPPATASVLENYFLAADSQFLCMTWEAANAERERPKREAEQARLKAEAEVAETQQNEIYALVATVTLTVGIIVTVFAYEYFKNRQAVKDRSLSSWLSFVDGKNFWIFIFCVVTLVTCLLYTPYNNGSNHPDIIRDTHATIFAIPKNFSPKYTRIDYGSIAFREILILIGCCAGYTATKVIKKH